jgi:hypothetical protein
MSIIAVPIQVDALVINESTDIVQLGADFAKLPYLDSLKIDHRTDIANLASSISYQPFNNQSSLLPGVHLHWALPDALTQGEVIDEAQKQARLARLKSEIVEYVTTQPSCSAADIVHHLSNERRMRNHGLTARKVGFFIPRYLSDLISFTLDHSTGKRLYHIAA